MGWLRSSKAYGFYARNIRRRLFGSAVAVPREIHQEWNPSDDETIDLAVDWRDEMFLHFHRPFRGRRALKSYLRTGRETLELVRTILDRLGKTPDQLDNVLEFACGYGRNTRFLRTLFDPARLYVCDVDPIAVESNANRFATQPLNSKPEPNEWVCERSFDFVFVASLFTHLSYETWGGWLKRLARTLSPEGHLIITTHGLDWLNGNNGVVRIEGGFCYRRANETSGRLSCDVYGSSYAPTDWVRNQLEEAGLEEAWPHHPNALWGQDVWVLRRRP